MRITTAQIQHFIDEGYLVAGGLIPLDVVAATRQAMWQALGIDPDDAATWPQETILVPHEVNKLMAPCRTTALEQAAEQLAGPHFVRGSGFSPVLNFPRPRPRAFEPMGFHIDGIDETTLWPDKRYMVMLVYLTDTAPFGGATAVRPGSHRQMFEHWVRSGGGPGRSTEVPDLPYRDPIPLPGRAGDVIFMHYLLAHGSSHNGDDHVRVGLNGTIRPHPDHPYRPKQGGPQSDWTPIDWTLRTDTF